MRACFTMLDILFSSRSLQLSRSFLQLLEFHSWIVSHELKIIWKRKYYFQMMSVHTLLQSQYIISKKVWLHCNIQWLKCLKLKFQLLLLRNVLDVYWWFNEFILLIETSLYLIFQLSYFKTIEWIKSSGVSRVSVLSCFANLLCGSQLAGIIHAHCLSVF